MADITLSAAEKKAIADMKALARRWPKSLWLFSANGTLHVMRSGPRGEHIHTDDDGVDPDYAITSVEIPNDGGDW